MPHYNPITPSKRSLSLVGVIHGKDACFMTCYQTFSAAAGKEQSSMLPEGTETKASTSMIRFSLVIPFHCISSKKTEVNLGCINK